MTSPDPLSYFGLKQIRAARVSEISETTATSSIPDEEKINFHIGNPLQDAKLTSAFMRIALGIDMEKQDLRDSAPEAVLEYLGWDASEKPKLEFLIRIIQNSIPYMPRGGYSRKTPHPLILTFRNWLERQQEPLYYNLGEESTRREIILASGGIHETTRVLLRALSDYLVITPARILCYRYKISFPESSFPNLQIINLAEDERVACDQIETISAQQTEIPTFVLIGCLMGEETRRKLRLYSTKAALFFIETNNAPNHLSLAREAKLVQRVIRLLTPAIFGAHLETLSPVFVVGNADFLSVIENVHFKLKGTPSASEVDFLNFLLEKNMFMPQEQETADIYQGRKWVEDGGTGGSADRMFIKLASRIENNLGQLINVSDQLAERLLIPLEEKITTISRIVEDRFKTDPLDEFTHLDSRELIGQLFDNCHNPVWVNRLERSFLSVFIKHQAQYQSDACMIASGSSRTALGILGFHCGINDVVIADLSWSYEQCFPNVHAVPLTNKLALDVDAMIQKVKLLCQADPHWVERGAVVINNPHNATGRIFTEESMKKLITYCLEHDIYVIDDLAYQNVAPFDGMVEIKTARQIADELVRTGILSAPCVDRLITVHSMSKTDCLAGARLAVVEIREQKLRQRFLSVNTLIRPNLVAIFICYLFYRRSIQDARAYWGLRNRLFNERTQALMTAMENLPSNRNPFGLEIIPPAGSMYPLLHIKNLPAGLSLDWLASSLARRGVGLLPLATFARTEAGYDTGRSSFRLTLGGPDHAGILLVKTRRLLIDLNRIIAEENARYNRKQLTRYRAVNDYKLSSDRLSRWKSITEQLFRVLNDNRDFIKQMSLPNLDLKKLREDFIKSYLPERLEVFSTRLQDRSLISDEMVWRSMQDDGNWLSDRLEHEFMKDSLQRRQELFRLRSYDRTVHPTQRYSLRAEIAFDAIIERLVSSQSVTTSQIENVAKELMHEYLGRNVSINSVDEANEILLDFDALLAAEAYSELFCNTTLRPFLSFWSDWDGSNRPSGQGHCLIASLVMENVRRMAHIVNLVKQVDSRIEINHELLDELESLPQKSKQFSTLLNNITQLTHQLEQRYRGVLPYSIDTSPFQQFTTRLHLRRDPARLLWQHNDRYEQKMRELRQQRRTMLETYFVLNKKLRKQLYALIPAILDNVNVEPLLREVVGYRDLLQHTAITPRIHQGIITGRDSFAVDTTVYNIQEINAIAGKYGNPGMTLGVQISLSTKPEALVSLDRKMRIQAEQVRRENPSLETPSVWLIPLFEDIDVVGNIPAYLDKIWDYATQSRHTVQTPQSRFEEIIAEIFVAGSDLSQQISQAHGAFQYLKAKNSVHTWLAEHGLAETVRIKLGSGEPMQRQGGYYSHVAGMPAFPQFKNHKPRFSRYLPEAAQKSTIYAVTPLQGVFLGGDLRTFQSCLSEQLRYLPVAEYANLLYHVRQTQQDHRQDIVRAVETIVESRLGAQNRNVQELERLTIGSNDVIYEGFLQELTKHFRQILYGRDEDVMGIHIISYFIGRSMPQLRDRPTSRRRAVAGTDRGQQILANIAEIIPFAKQGSLLRAIAHNQSQTTVLGINQLTTGLFRGLEYYAQNTFPEAEREGIITERILPNLPVYEILHSLRIYQDWSGEYIRRVETAFPAGNSAFVALREDADSMQRMLPLFQQELIRRHGLDVNDFLDNDIFIQDLLPTLRPDLAVLLQKDLFNTSTDLLLVNSGGVVDDEWKKMVDQLLRLPEQIRFWRSLIWELIGDSIFQRVQSFTELATALYSFSTMRTYGPPPMAARGPKLSAALADFIRSAPVEDEMRQFLVGAVEYLNAFTEGNIEIPVSIIRALNDVDKIAMIEEGSLPENKQDVLRFALLQIARLAGESG
jgi:aspartate/methionine/tyrosine aminotransferase